jgi:hypothetical protein
MTYTFTIMDRLYLESAIAAERGGKDDVQELRGELFDKISLSTGERTAYLKAEGAGLLIELSAPPLKIELEKSASLKLKSLLLAWKEQTANVHDRVPVASLIEKLNATESPATSSKKRK